MAVRYFERNVDWYFSDPATGGDLPAEYNLPGRQDGDGGRRDGAFIARSRTILPALLAVAEAQIESHHEIPANQAEQGLPAGAVMCCYGCNGGSLPCPVLAAWANAFGVEE